MSLEERTIALIEDDPIMGESLMERLTLEGAKVLWWQDCRTALENLAAFAPDLVVCDIRLPDGTGEDVFKTASATPECPPFLFVTGHGDIDQAVRLMRNGAGDYITKPFETARFLDRVEQLLRPVEQGATPILGVSRQMHEIQRLLQRIGRLSAPALLSGETGVGKEVCARYLHGVRDPATPFVAVNCAAIPKDLMESELFGHEKGAFTGASSRHLGYAERAQDGILFLDEIGELDLKLQAKLLRLIEDRSFHRIGGETAVAFRARLICATNADLQARIKTGSFREDLYYRINVLTVTIPPLRERPDDIEWLAERLVEALANDLGAELVGLSGHAIDELRAHDWPGNVRELRNRIERAVSLSPGPRIMPGDLFPDRHINPSVADPKVGSLEAARDEAEKREILRALRQSGGAIVEAAGALGISRTTMWEKMRRHRIEGLPN
ncbi:sigma-54-dependent transcriptional regulator [Microvirga brassicacearum]|uniref:Sigma-54-dependent Fis family transcriptional regulator n=1 Tax=Microvirga brassicacearum TaxID=2580413 RepID=A0A5N3P3A5_9HYPH|nr:sigma-54 dependent transcriptional regulator [Microvirga brassicacearum]KAB0264200.1 sigma-54-dependent Fis family transcriptional regulator [Microvirga brassicacearum]